MFYEQLKMICKKQNTTPTVLVKSMGMSGGNVTSWKNGGMPSVEVLLEISKIMGVSTDFLLTGKEGGAEIILYTEEEKELIKMYDRLNKCDQCKVYEYLEMLSNKNNNNCDLA